eukprot:TRINITY_DN5733_c0_g1_i1.p1 TRINITY_DN5733_c0_g1~~TRINITY_DN5733_c0_g1_i1.p1  ORF type:complete len:115 (-),score=23.94 TRINITY_DN5733_c0_g1_i1:29-373(-)
MKPGPTAPTSIPVSISKSMDPKVLEIEKTRDSRKRERWPRARQHSPQKKSFLLLIFLHHHLLPRVWPSFTGKDGVLDDNMMEEMIVKKKEKERSRNDRNPMISLSLSPRLSLPF